MINASRMTRRIKRPDEGRGRIELLNILLLQSLLSAHNQIEDYCKRNGLLVPYDPELHHRVKQALDLLGELNGTASDGTLRRNCSDEDLPVPPREALAKRVATVLKHLRGVGDPYWVQLQHLAAWKHIHLA